MGGSDKTQTGNEVDAEIVKLAHEICNNGPPLFNTLENTVEPVDLSDFSHQDESELQLTSEQLAGRSNKAAELIFSMMKWMCAGESGVGGVKGIRQELIKELESEAIEDVSDASDGVRNSHLFDKVSQVTRLAFARLIDPDEGIVAGDVDNSRGLSADEYMARVTENFADDLDTLRTTEGLDSEAKIGALVDALQMGMDIFTKPLQ
eukprot:m.260142 g.260142  ORF g.260142 m.260142 type:complete len:206 (+) comp39281_c0_seq1:209-826(+)